MFYEEKALVDLDCPVYNEINSAMVEPAGTADCKPCVYCNCDFVASRLQNQEVKIPKLQHVVHVEPLSPHSTAAAV